MKQKSRLIRWLLALDLGFLILVLGFLILQSSLTKTMFRLPLLLQCQFY